MEILLVENPILRFGGSSSACADTRLLIVRDVPARVQPRRTQPLAVTVPLLPEVLAVTRVIPARRLEPEDHSPALIGFIPGLDGGLAVLYAQRQAGGPEDVPDRLIAQAHVAGNGSASQPTPIGA